ncbi:TPA: DNA-binding protein [Serratia marcescens]|nr:DNA-binding protein [Serratia marcescens]
MNTIEETTPLVSLLRTRPKDQKKLLDRTLSILGPTIEKVAADRELSRAQSMSDSELLQFLYEKLLENNTRISERELRRIHRLNEGTRKFTEHLKESGGTLKAGEVAERIKKTRQTVNNMRKANKLLAVRPGNDYLFPDFQFSGTQVVKGVEELLERLGSDLGAVSKVSFFTAMYFFGEDGPNVITALKSEHADTYWDEIKRQAGLFGRHVAK